MDTTDPLEGVGALTPITLYHSNIYSIQYATYNVLDSQIRLILIYSDSYTQCNSSHSFISILYL